MAETELNTHTVEVLELGVGFFGDKAVVRFKDGFLKSVKMSALEMIEEEPT